MPILPRVADLSRYHPHAAVSFLSHFVAPRTAPHSQRSRPRVALPNLCRSFAEQICVVTDASAVSALLASTAQTACDRASFWCPYLLALHVMHGGSARAWEFPRGGASWYWFSTGLVLALGPQPIHAWGDQSRG